MLNIPPETFEQIRNAICRPEGTVVFEYGSPITFKKDSPAGVLLQIQSGGHIFHLERTEKGLLSLFYSSPGSGTRVASIDLNMLPEFERALLSFTWSPKEMHFCCGPRVPGGSLISAEAGPSPHQFRVGSDGTIFQIGDENVQVMEMRVYQGDKPILMPTAIEAWRNTLKAIEILWTGKSDEGFIFETVTASLTLSILVTGLEAYTKARFLELEMEGISPDANALFTNFASKAERESNIFAEMERAAKESNISLFKQIVDSRRINFQSFDHIKRAYRFAYGIMLANISISSQVSEKLQKYIKYRHRVVHVSPLLSALNIGQEPSEKLVFANREFAEHAVTCFDEVITKLHEATFTLKRQD